MTVRLMQVFYNEEASEETDCFHATVIVNGLWAGTVMNDGRGGDNIYFPTTLRQKLRGYSASMPLRKVWLGNMEVTLQPDEDWLISDLLHDHLEQ